MTTIALYNLKGGVGKTACCVNFAYLSSTDGYRTLLWDLDPQGSATFYYQVKPKLKGGIRDVMDQSAALKHAIMDTDYERLDLIPADQSSKSLDVLLEETRHSRKRLKGILSELKGHYDFVFLDCPPGLSALAENIFHAVDVILMPTIPTTLSARTYELVKSYIKDKDLDLSKIMCFFSQVDGRKNLHNDVMDTLIQDKRFFSHYIPNLSDIEKMGIYRAPVGVFARSGFAAQCYRDLWEEIKEGVL